MMVSIRPLRQEDFDAVVEIDTLVLNAPRLDYFEAKFAMALEVKNSLVTSMVAEVDGRVIAFVMCELYAGEYGLPDNWATLDTIGIHPDYRKKGVGGRLITELCHRLKEEGVKKITTLVSFENSEMARFFRENGFKPAKAINLELDIP